ncbi:MAG: flagellar basal-body rod protein FlgF [Alphaproteobacteria bacterium]|nr:flagellar basal-body rod protein FlgF [Alphaproteobacteria bacterium]
MENSLYIGLSKQVVLRENMSIIANNVANLNTPGFRGQNMIFSEYIEDPRYMKEDISLVLDYGQYQMTDPGSIKDTGNPLDIALVGNGFLGIQTPEGVQYTRAGNLSMDAEGVLRNARGMAVASVGGGDITIPADAKYIAIDKKGVVSTDQGQIGQLMVVEFENTQELNPAGNGLYVTEAPAIPAEKTTVLQGKIEGSNVQAVVEMTRMIDVHREYQAVQNMMQSEHERLRTMTQRLAKTQA